MDYRVEQIYFYYKGIFVGWYTLEHYETLLDSLIINILEDSVTVGVRKIW